jgi:hypothetical protein
LDAAVASLLQARSWVKSSGLGLDVRDEAAWQDWAASQARPETMPSEPHHFYQAQQQWVSWEDWLRPDPLVRGPPRASGSASDGGLGENQPGRRSAAEIVDAVEKELVENGLGFPAPFRGCRFLVVDLDLLTRPSSLTGQKRLSGLELGSSEGGPPLRGPAAAQAVAKLRSRNLHCRVRSRRQGHFRV